MQKMIEVLLTEQSGPDIELRTTLGEIDLHNFADFVGFEYDVDGEMRLVWIPWKASEFRLGKHPISRAILVLKQVSSLAILPRDPDIPRSEDRTLEDNESHRDGPDRWRMRFSFAGGMKIEVVTRHVELLVEREDDLE